MDRRGKKGQFILTGSATPAQKGILHSGAGRISTLRENILFTNKIGYIPQTIYLSDDSIRNNVAFGIEEENIDEQAVIAALKQAQLYDFVDTLPEGLDTCVGDRGIRLSGGQRQRI